MRGKTARLAGDDVPVHPSSAKGKDDDSVGSATVARRYGSEKRQRSTVLGLRLTAAERALIDKHAEMAGLSAASYVREIALDAPPPRPVRRPPIERKELSRLLGELGRVGNNLNQLAHTANTGEPTDRRDLLIVLQSLVEVRNAILKALGRIP